MEVLVIILVVIIVLFVGMFLVTGLTGAPYVPTLKPGLGKAFRELYPLGKKDLLIDLGAGDGVVLAEAEKCGARALGIELNPVLTLIMKWRFRRNKRIDVRCRNFYHFDFPEDTTVAYAFAVSPHIAPIYHKIQQESVRLKKPLYFISNAFEIPEVKPVKKVGSFYLYKIAPSDALKEIKRHPSRSSCVLAVVIPLFSAIFYLVSAYFKIRSSSYSATSNVFLRFLPVFGVGVVIILIFYIVRHFLGQKVAIVLTVVIAMVLGIFNFCSMPSEHLRDLLNSINVTSASGEVFVVPNDELFREMGTYNSESHPVLAAPLDDGEKFWLISYPAEAETEAKYDGYKVVNEFLTPDYYAIELERISDGEM